MKRAVMLLVAVLCMLAASSVQATDTSLVFFYQIGNQPADVAEGVHFAIEKNGEVVMDSTLPNDEYKVDVTLDPGIYTLNVEQESTEFVGSCNFKVDDVQNADPDAYDQAPMLFFLNKKGVVYVKDAYECKGEDCDEHCICKVLNENVTNRVCKCYDVCCNKTETIAPAVKPAANTNAFNACGNVCDPCAAQGMYAGGNGFGGGRFCGWGGLAAIGAAAAALAVAVAEDDDKPNYVTP